MSSSPPPPGPSPVTCSNSQSSLLVDACLRTAAQQLPFISLSESSSLQSSLQTTSLLTRLLHSLLHTLDEPTTNNWCSLMDSLMDRMRCGDVTSCLPFCDQLPTEAEAVYRRHVSNVPHCVLGQFGWLVEEGGVDAFVHYVTHVLDDQGRAEFSRQCCVLAHRWRGGAVDKLFTSSTPSRHHCDTDDSRSDDMDTFSSFSIDSSVTVSQDEQSTCL